MTCDSCQKDKRQLRGAIINGKYGQFCTPCLTPAKRQHHVGSAAYSRDRDRETHAVDLLQPWDARGNPNTEFIRHYPEEAKDTFTQEELEAYG